jgi:hypothetical protein
MARAAGADPVRDRVGAAGRPTARTDLARAMHRDMTAATGRRRVTDRAPAGDPMVDRIDRATTATTSTRTGDPGRTIARTILIVRQVRITGIRRHARTIATVRHGPTIATVRHGPTIATVRHGPTIATVRHGPTTAGHATLASHPGPDARLSNAGRGSATGRTQHGRPAPASSRPRRQSRRSGRTRSSSRDAGPSRRPSSPGASLTG